MVWTALAVGALIGLLVGWRAGRLHLMASQGYYGWRAAVDAVPIAYRGAVYAIKAAIGYMLAAGLVAALAVLVVWAANK